MIYSNFDGIGFKNLRQMCIPTGFLERQTQRAFDSFRRRGEAGGISGYYVG
jgi:hypothetical protein